MNYLLNKLLLNSLYNFSPYFTKKKLILKNIFIKNSFNIFLYNSKINSLNSNFKNFLNSVININKYFNQIFFNTQNLFLNDINFTYCLFQSCITENRGGAIFINNNNNININLLSCNFIECKAPNGQG